MPIMGPNGPMDPGAMTAGDMAGMPPDAFAGATAGDMAAMPADAMGWLWTAANDGSICQLMQWAAWDQCIWR